jgi:hypothetical protein
MTGGKISGNTGESGNTSNVRGGGVRMQHTSTMIFSGGEISGNSLTSSAATGGIGGAGISVDINSTLTMTGGNISGNTGEAYGGSNGGGVRLSDSGSTFTMNGGTIGGNTVRGSNSHGGGVYADTGTVFKKIPADGSVTSGTVYGSGEGANSNKVEDSAGASVTGRGNAVSAPSAERDGTLGPADSFVFP